MRYLFALVFVALLSFLPAPAHAGKDGTQCGTNDSVTYPGCDEGVAQAECQVQLAAALKRWPGSAAVLPCERTSYNPTTKSGSYRCGVRDWWGLRDCGPTMGAPFYNFSGQCDARSIGTLSQNMTVLPTVQATECSRGCRYNIDPKPVECYAVAADDTYDPLRVGWNCEYRMLPTVSTCKDDGDGDKPPIDNKPPEKCEGTKTRLPDGTCVDRGQCPVGQHDVNGKCTPDGACPTGKVKAPDSSCVDETCPEGQAKAKDGTCKKDDDGDGKPNDGEDTGKFSGGEDCKMPPQCSGDNILCGQARIQWRIDCNTRRNDTITGGGGCTAPPVCAGEKCSAMEYSQLLQQWRTACAVEAMSRNVTGTPGSDAQPSWTKADGMNQNPGAGEQAGDTKVFSERQVNVDVNSTPIVGGGGTCPGFPVGGGGGWAAEVLGEIASPPPQWCSLIASLRSIILLFALVVVIYIQVRGG